MIDFLSFRVIKQNSLKASDMRDKCWRRAFTIDHLSATDRPAYDRRPRMFPAHVHLTKWMIDLRAWLQKQKEKNVIWFLEYVKRNNFGRGKGDKLIIVTEAPTRRTSARAQCIPAWVCQQRLPRRGEKLISPRCDAHKLMFASKRLAICVYFYR